MEASYFMRQERKQLEEPDSTCFFPPFGKNYVLERQLSLHFSIRFNVRCLQCLKKSFKRPFCLMSGKKKVCGDLLLKSKCTNTVLLLTKHMRMPRCSWFHSTRTSTLASKLSSKEQGFRSNGPWRSPGLFLA